MRGNYKGKYKFNLPYFKQKGKYILSFYCIVMELSEKERIKKVIYWVISQGIAETQEEIAILTGYNPSAFSQIVSGKKPVSTRFIKNLCKLSEKINENYLLNGSGDMILNTMGRLCFLRKSLKMKQIDVADVLGITQSAYSAIELGKNELTDRNAEVLANKLGVSKTWLLTGLGDMFDDNDDKNIDNELNTAVQELAAEGKSIGGSVPYEFVERLFREREQHDRIIQSLQSTIEALQNTVAELSQALKKS